MSPFSFVLRIILLLTKGYKIKMINYSTIENIRKTLRVSILMEYGGVLALTVEKAIYYT